MFTDSFHMLPLAAYCLPLLVPRWITSGQIGGCPWGNTIFIEVTHHCGPLPWLPNVTREKQMVHGHGMIGYWNTWVSWYFLCFSAHLFYILFRDYDRPFLFFRDVSIIVMFCRTCWPCSFDDTEHLFTCFAASCSGVGWCQVCWGWNSSYQSNSLYCSLFFLIPILFASW